ncbi:MAG: zinc ABC transporter substrate-binding protein [Nitrosopumilus sp.]|nr:zinc ABC transporter substrate-binding protein [Nitrosopumilus sp.]
MSFLIVSLFTSSFVTKTIAITNSLSINNINNNLLTDTNVVESGNSIPYTSNQTNLKIFTSFYPLYDFVKKIGKDKVDVSLIVPAGIEPHDFEPTAKQIIEMQKANLIFINGAGFELWINKLTNSNIIDLSRDLPIEMVDNTPDPHTWLDPVMVKTQAKTIFENLTSMDPQNTDYYMNNYIQFDTNLEELNSNIRNNLTDCNLNDFIAFHDAFGYFAKRYGLTQNTIQGLSQEADINPQRISDAINLSKQLGINIIFSEDNIDPRLSNTIANEINGQVLILSPIEILSDEEKQMNKDYFSKMYDNMNNLKIALKCTS